MRLLILMAVTMSVPACSEASEPAMPLASGRHAFQHRFAEHPTIPSIEVRVEIEGTHIVVVNPRASPPFPAGTLAEGQLMWHAASRQWIIGQDAADRVAREVGGCSDGPETVDLVNRIYWTC